MFGHFDEASMPPELKFIFKEMKKLANENETLRSRVTALETNQENLRKAINKVAKESPRYFDAKDDPFDPQGSVFTEPLPEPSSWLDRFFMPKKKRKK